MSEETISPSSTTGNSFGLEIIYNYGKRKAKIKVICFKQDSASFIPGNVVNLNTSYKLDTWSRDLSTDFTLGNCLFEAVKWTKNANPDQYGCSGYGIGFNALCLGINVAICRV